MSRDSLCCTYFTRWEREKFAIQLDRPRSRTVNLPGGPTTKNMSAINSLLNMAAFLSLMLIFVACQFGSMVDALALLKLIGRCCWLSSGWVVNGDVGTLLLEGGCVIWMMSPDPSWLSTYKLGVGLCSPTPLEPKQKNVFNNQTPSLKQDILQLTNLGLSRQFETQHLLWKLVILTVKCLRLEPKKKEYWNKRTAVVWMGEMFVVLNEAL